MSEPTDQTVLFKIFENLATNTEATKNIEKHLITLNGKVATQESFTQTLKNAQDLTAATVKEIDDKNRKKQETQSKLAWLTIENIFKLVFGVAITYLLYKAGLK